MHPNKSSSVDLAINDQIDKGIANLYNRKAIHFKNPEKLNGRYPNSFIPDQQVDVTFIGRELSISEDNWTWILTELNAPNREHSLSVLKYPQTDGYATVMTNAWGLKNRKEILLNDLHNFEFMKRELLSLTNLPF